VRPSAGAAFLSVVIGDVEGDNWILLCPATEEPYAGRDNSRYFRKVFPFRASDVIAADGNLGHQNHPDITHVLYGDGSVRSFSLSELKSIGKVAQDSEYLVVGEDSPIADLRMLKADRPELQDKDE